MTAATESAGVSLRSRRAASAVTLTGLFFAGFLAFGIGVYAFTQFLAPLQQEFGWGRAVMGGMMSAFWLAAPFVLVASYALDRVGIRTLVIAGAAMEAAGLALMIFVSSPLEFYLVRFLMGVGKVIAVTPLPIAVARWFPQRTGIALAVVLCGWHVGGLVMAPAAAALIAAFGWRVAALLLAVIIIVVMAMASMLMRDPNPRRDIEVAPALNSVQSSSDDESSALPAWASVLVLAAIGLGTFAFYAGYAGLLSQLSPLLSDAGFSARAIGEATGSVAVSAMVGVLVCGLLTQLLSPRISGAAVLLLMGLVEVGTTTLGAGAGTAPLAAFVILLGLLIGGGDPILIEALRRAVPLRRFNHAYGWWYLVCLAALAVAPVLAGAAFDRDANYRAVFYAMGVVSMVAAAVWLYVLRVQRMSTRLPPLDLQAVVASGLCTGCGLCESMAGRESVEMRLAPNGHLRPSVRKPVSDLALRKIMQVCPGVSIPRPTRSAGALFHSIWGSMISLQRSWAADPIVRHKAAAGGTLTALGGYALSSGQADCVVHVRASTTDPMLTDALVSRTPADVLSGSQSRYGPAAPLVHIMRLLDAGERMIVIAKPCDVAAIRSLARIDARVDKQVVMLLSLFCGGVPTVHMAESIVRFHGLTPAQLRVLRWRGEGWPGPTLVESHDGRRFSMSYEQTWYDPRVPWTYDMQFRCKICPDAIGEHADVVAPDGWLMKDGTPQFAEAPGVNIAIARTPRGERFIAAAVAAGALVTDGFTLQQLDLMHADHKPRKQERWARNLGLMLAGQPTLHAPGFRALRNAVSAGLWVNIRAFSGAFRRALSGRNREKNLSD